MRTYAYHHACGLILVTGVLSLIEHKLHIHESRIVRYVLKRDLSLIDIRGISGDRSYLGGTYLVAGQLSRPVPGFKLIPE